MIKMETNIEKVIINIHSDYIDKRINDVKKRNKWNSIIINTCHEDFIKDYSANVFTNLVRDIFTKSYMKKFPCSDCNNPSMERCHGINEERPLLIKRALEKVWPDTTKPLVMKEIIIAFLEEHKYTNFTFKCKTCHKNEKKRCL
jgi:hypothetical protein